MTALSIRPDGTSGRIRLLCKTNSLVTVRVVVAPEHGHAHARRHRRRFADCRRSAGQPCAGAIVAARNHRRRDTAPAPDAWAYRPLPPELPAPLVEWTTCRCSAGP